MDLKTKIREVPNFPKEGVLFYDITTLLRDAGGFSRVVHRLAEFYRGEGVTKVVAIESRGFIFGAPLAIQLGAGFVPVRKPGKLPAEVYERKYDLEYGSNSLAIHKDAIDPGERVLIVDDLLATGGTMAATVPRQELGVVVALRRRLVQLGGRRSKYHVCRCSADLVPCPRSSHRAREPWMGVAGRRGVDGPRSRRPGGRPPCPAGGRRWPTPSSPPRRTTRSPSWAGRTAATSPSTSR
jgi:adenine phosphoribosyltransferase